MSIKVTPIMSFQAIQKLVDAGDLYVINNSDLGNKQSRGNIVMDINGENNNSFAVTILNTWVPQNLANFCDPQLYMKSNTFRNFVAKNILIVIATEEALSILATSSAKEALKEAQAAGAAYAANLASSLDTNTISAGSVTIDTKTGRIQETVKTVDAVQMSADDNELHRMVASFNQGSLSDEDAIVALMTLSPTVDALKIAGGAITNTGSRLYFNIGEMISNATRTSVDEGDFRQPV